MKELNRLIIMFISVCYRYFALYYSSTILNYLLLFILLILTVINIVNTKFEKKQFKRIFTLLVLSAFVFLLNNEDSLFIYMFPAIAFYDKDIKKTIKYFLIFAILSFVVTISAGQLGIIKIYTAGRNIDGVGIYRNSLGFGNVNSPFVYYLGIVFGLYYFNKEKPLKLFLIYIITTLIALWMFKETDCRTGMYIYVMFVITSFIYNEKINNKLKPIITYLFLIVTIFSFILALVYGNTIYNSVNLTLSNRPYFTKYYIENLKFINLFGSEIISPYVLDNFYLSLLVKSGIISYLLYFYLFFKGSKIISKDYKLILICIFTLLYGILECGLYGNFIFVILIISIIKGVNYYEKN